MKVKIYKSALDGILVAPSSKSLAIRYIFASMLCDKKTDIYIESLCDDISASLDCVKALNGDVKKDGNIYTVYPIKKSQEKREIFVRESATVLRISVAICSALGGEYSFFGEKTILNRFIEGTEEFNGVEFSDKKVPLFIKGKLKGGNFKLKDLKSSQTISGLLFALPLLEKDSKIFIEGEIPSQKYIDMTISVLKEFKIEISKTEYGFFVKGGQKYISPERIMVEGDYSSASFFIGANTFSNRVRVLGLNKDSVQPDKEITNLLLKFNAKGTTFDLKDNLDLVPIISVCSLFAYSDTKITGLKNLVYKESNRLKFLKEELEKVGGEIEIKDFDLIIKGKAGVEGNAVLDCHFDHRLAMAFSMLATASNKPVIIDNVECVKKSFPSFFEEFARIKGKIEIIEN